MKLTLVLLAAPLSLGAGAPNEVVQDQLETSTGVGLS